MLEAGRGSLSLTCTAAANPPARVQWFRAGRLAGQVGGVLGTELTTADQGAVLEFSPVTREVAGEYACQAENSVGRADPAPALVDVLCEFQVRYFTSNTTALHSSRADPAGDPTELPRCGGGRAAGALLQRRGRPRPALRVAAARQEGGAETAGRPGPARHRARPVLRPGENEKQNVFKQRTMSHK